MKLRDIIASRDFTGYVSSSSFGSQNMSHDIFGDYDFDEWETINALEKTKRFTTYSIRTWLCTDTIVGIHVVCFDDEPMYVTYQPYRKSDITYYFVSDFAFRKFKDFWNAHRPEKEMECNIADSILDVDISNTEQYSWQNGPIKF